MELEIGSIYEGKVTGITKFGAFVLLPTGKSGMVHISEVANTFVSDINDYLKEGQAVTVKLISIDQQGRINLSIKKALPQEPRTGGQRPPRPAGQQRPTGAPVRPSGGPRFTQAQQPLPPSGDLSFEDKLKKFMTASEGKMADLNRNIDGKRGGRRRR